MVAAESHPISAIPHSRSDNLALDFVNSRFSDHRGSGVIYDRLPMPAWWSWLLDRWDLERCAAPSPDEVTELARVRVALRRALERGMPLSRHAHRQFDALLARAPMIWSTGSPKRLPRLMPHHSTSGAQYVAASVVLSLVQTLADRPPRVRRCGNPDCTFLFQDQSHRGSRRWCDAGLCGNLMTVRSFRAARARSAG
ncbi:MAG: CGNR zinc finger domain-containing protein [Candidatus Dormibacteria bacterium]